MGGRKCTDPGAAGLRPATAVRLLAPPRTTCQIVTPHHLCLLQQLLPSFGRGMGEPVELQARSHSLVPGGRTHSHSYSTSYSSSCSHSDSHCTPCLPCELAIGAFHVRWEWLCPWCKWCLKREGNAWVGGHDCIAPVFGLAASRCNVACWGGPACWGKWPA